LERLFEAKADLTRSRLRDHDVAALDRPLEDRPRMPLRCQRPSRWGRTATLTLNAGRLGDSPPEPVKDERRAVKPAAALVFPSMGRLEDAAQQHVDTAGHGCPAAPAAS
jgi:hypothetical protein